MLFVSRWNARDRIVSLEQHLKKQPSDEVVRKQLEALQQLLADAARRSIFGAFTPGHYVELMPKLETCGPQNRVHHPDINLIGGV